MVGEVTNVIIGNGDIASVLPQNDGKLYFASGVSNSQCTDEAEYQRELDLLLDQPRDAHIVYFSSLAVFYGNTRYTRHKRDMEVTIKINFPKNTVVRIGNILWGDNPNTLINYLKAHPRAEIRDEERYIIDKEEFLHWVNKIPTWNAEITITGRRMKIQEIWEEYVKDEYTI